MSLTRSVYELGRLGSGRQLASHLFCLATRISIYHVAVTSLFLVTTIAGNRMTELHNESKTKKRQVCFQCM